MVRINQNRHWFTENLRRQYPKYYTWAEMAGVGGENRLKSYKNKGQDLDEGRRRREEEGIQLRKTRRDEQVRLMK